MSNSHTAAAGPDFYSALWPARRKVSGRTGSSYLLFYWGGAMEIGGRKFQSQKKR